jgi:hypothetical protein
VLIYLLIFMAICSIGTFMAKRAEQKKALRKTFVQAHPDWYIDISPFDTSLIGIRHDGNQVMFGTPDAPLKAGIHDLRSVEILDNGAVVEGVRTSGHISRLALRITLDLPDVAVQQVTFFATPGNGIKIDTPLVQQSIEKLTYWHSVLLARLAKLDEQKFAE